MSEPVETLEGWYVLHDFRRVDWDRWERLDPPARQAALDDLQQLWRSWAAEEADGRGSFGVFAVLGNKADLLFLQLRGDLEALHAAKHTLNRSALGRLLTPAYSYLSVVELSAYLAQGPADPDQNPYLKARLYPILPKSRYLSFYPMSKRRQGEDNWYRLSREQRAQLMRGHGAIGHRYRDRVTQIITGSQGLDDWEWGVSLFADDPLAIKKIVYEMRFDEASARYADFGPFYVGLRLDADGLSRLFAERP